jgi:hypothetical protein
VTTARDGTPVDLYLRFPPRGEAELVHEATPEGAEIWSSVAGSVA